MRKQVLPRQIALIVPFALILVFQGCGTAKKKEPPSETPGANVHIEKPGVGEETLPPPWDPGPGGTDLEPPERIEPGPGGVSPLSEADPSYEYNVIDRVHFDYDSDVIRSEWILPLQNNANWMKDHPGYFMIIEGHCDERGTSEYNLALGERRASSVRKYMIQNGVEADRLQIRSFGEERPLDPGSGEDAWAQNRRAEFLVGQQ